MDDIGGSRMIGEARRLLRGTRYAALATLISDEEAQDRRPYASLVAFASDVAGRPVLLMSRLAEHRRNLDADARLSLLLHDRTPDKDPLDSPRLSLLGTLVPATEAASRRYLALHRAAEQYAGFADFDFFRVEVRRAHLIGGFGRISWIDSTALIDAAAATDESDSEERRLVESAAQSQRAAIDAYCRHRWGNSDATWTLAALDRFGFDIAAGTRIERADFEREAQTLDLAVECMAEMIDRGGSN